VRSTISLAIMLIMAGTATARDCNSVWCSMDARRYGALPGYTLVDNGSRWGKVIKTPQPVVDATPHEAVEAMLDAVGVTEGDLLYDPGCGDGRICIEASRRGAQAVGIEIRPEVARLAKETVRRAGVGRIRIVAADATKLDLRAANVVAMYLTEDTMRKLVPRISQDARVVSYLHPIPGRRNREIVVADKWKIYVVEPEIVSLTAFPM